MEDVEVLDHKSRDERDYVVRIEEVLSRCVMVSASNVFEAESIVDELRSQGALVLTADDFVDYTIEVIDSNDPSDSEDVERSIGDEDDEDEYEDEDDDDVW